MVENWRNDVKRIAEGIRLRTLKHTIENNGGYLSQACSSAELFATLYTKVLNIGNVEKPIKPQDFTAVPSIGNKMSFTGSNYNGPQSPEYDRFILSPAQYALVLYSTLIETKRMSLDGLEFFNKDGSSVEMIGAEHSPGMEVMTGSLGQGISQAAGIAYARKLKGETGRVVIFLSDGELQIGQTWEAIQTMAHHNLDNILIYIDVNGYQCDGKMTDVMNIEPIEERFKAFGAHTFRIDGHDIDMIVDKGSIKIDGKPIVIVADTNPSKDMDILKSRCKYHYIRFSDEVEKDKYRDELKNREALINITRR
jgi:transketolase